MLDERPLLVLGDSHVRYMKTAANLKLFGSRTVACCEVPAATASGLRNPNSQTAAARKFRSFLRRHDKDSILAFHLGEVDCGVLIWQRSVAQNITPRMSLSRSISAYFLFVDKTIKSGFKNIIVTGATLPTITDTDQLGAVVNQRRSAISVTQAERMKLSLDFNEKLALGARNRLLPFVDIAAEVIDPLTGLVSTRFRNANPADHHMDSTLAAHAWGPKLAEAAASFGLPPDGQVEAKQFQQFATSADVN